MVGQKVSATRKLLVKLMSKGEPFANLYAFSATLSEIIFQQIEAVRESLLHRHSHWENRALAVA
jgi:hypothetical protein